MDTARRTNTGKENASNGVLRPSASEVKEAAFEAVSSVNTLYEASHSFLERQTNDRPYAVLGAAAGVGFILGGGLASRLTRVLLVVGGRMLVTEFLEASSRDREDAES